jgi:hypothetical protein
LKEIVRGVCAALSRWRSIVVWQTGLHGAAPKGSIRAIQLKAEVSVNPSVLVGYDGLSRQSGRGNADARYLLDRSPDCHELHETVAELGDVSLDADDVLRAQLIGFALEARSCVTILPRVEWSPAPRPWMRVTGVDSRRRASSSSVNGPAAPKA